MTADTLTVEASSDGTLVVAELFGPTIQGEGPSLGHPAMFLRLGGCNLTCSFCDTPYTWDARRYNLREQMTRRDVDELAAALLAGGPDLIVITGGEPLLQQRYPGFRRLVEVLTAADRRVEIETNATITPAGWLLSNPGVHWRISPKLAHAGDPRDRRLVPAALRVLTGHPRTAVKIVCGHVADLAGVAELVTTYRIPTNHVWIMPEGTTPAQITAAARALVAEVVARGWRLTTRLHIYLWDDERGR